MSGLFKNIVKLPPPHTARSYSELTPVYTADEVAKTVSSFEVELAKANERVKELEGENKGLSIRISTQRETIRNYQKEAEQLRARERELEQNQPPIENGKNRYGLDASYFRNVINRELNRSLANHKPDELARVLARLSRTADESVMFEPEFSNKFAIDKKIEALEECVGVCGFLSCEDSLKARIKQLRNQLRKEQE